MVITRVANTKHWNQTVCIRGKLKLAPIEKKNNTKKKSLMGFKLIAIYWLIGLEAKLTPAIKAPISADNPMLWANSAKPKHQPSANRKIYS